MPSNALRRTLEIEKALRNQSEVQNVEITVIETPDREHHVANVRMKPEAELVELTIDALPLTDY